MAIPSTPPLYDVTAVEPLPGFNLRLTFCNGERRILNMTSFLARASGVLLSLRQIAKFRQAFVAYGTVCWPGNIDLDPEWLYQDSIPEMNEDVGRIGVAKGLFEVPDEQPAPFDSEWDRMPEVGLEKWPTYSDDVAAWATSQAQALRNRDVENLDWDHLADEILDVAKAERRELEARVSNLMVSLARHQFLGLALDAAALRRMHEQRKLVTMQLADNPSLKPCLASQAWLSQCWSSAMVALGDQGYQIAELPESSPWGCAELLNESSLSA